MSLSSAKGVYIIAPTPFHPDGRIDDASIDRMTDFFEQIGADGLTLLGQLGEASKMTLQTDRGRCSPSAAERHGRI